MTNFIKSKTVPHLINFLQLLLNNTLNAFALVILSGVTLIIIQLETNLQRNLQKIFLKLNNYPGNISSIKTINGVNCFNFIQYRFPNITNCIH